jgi:aromatic ring-opening dioxygenase catalytic subunit (LigB family)
LLSTPPERWDLRAADDRVNPEHPFRGKVYNFPDLVEARRGELDFEKETSLDMRTIRHERNQRAMDRLGQKLAEVNPDVVVVVGDHPPGDEIYPVPTLANAIVDQAMVDEFDVAISAEQPKDKKGLIGVGHAVGFIYRRILKDRPIPVVPILLNTYFPPNQPTAKRCYEFGQSIGRAIKGWNGENKNKRVAICASGGISHFVVDEDFDNRMIDAMKKRDTKTIFAEPENMFQSGTSETKNWIAVCGILSQTGLEMNMVDYVPSYRSEAGTGCGMGYATWE